MTTRMQTGLLLVTFSAVLTGCDTRQATTVAGPSPVVATAPDPPNPFLDDVTLSGTVYQLVDGLRLGIEGVSVYCEQCGVETHNFASTDSMGVYAFPTGFWTEGRASFPARIFVSKAGYHDPEGVPKITSGNPSGPGWREVVIDGDTRFDIELTPN